MNISAKPLPAILILGLVCLPCLAAVYPYPAATPDGYATGTTGGGEAPPVTVTSAEAFKAVAGDDRPAVIVVQGRLEVGNVRIGSNKTILGADSSSGLYGGRIRVRGDNCILQNLTFGPSNSDAVELSGATRVFLHQCEFYDAGDGLLDIVRQSDYVTVSWCKFYYIDQTGQRQATLAGSGQKADAGKLHVTLHHNWYAQGCHSMMPGVQYGQVHIYNHYYSSTASEYCIGIGGHSRIRVENTCFDHVKGAWYDQDGVNNDGRIGCDGLRLVNASTPAFAPNAFPVFTPPYAYSMDPVDQVKDIVMAGAGNVFGRGIGGPEGYRFCCKEGRTCTFSGTVNLAYGAKGRFHFLRNVTGGRMVCNNKTFVDPIYGEEKACYLQQVSDDAGGGRASSPDSSLRASARQTAPREPVPWDHGPLEVSKNGRFLQLDDGKPFFWLADTAWLLFEKLDREEVETYLEDRRQKGFNVIQVMVLHTSPQKNAYGAEAWLDGNPATPRVTSDANDYWNHVDFVIDRAAAKGLYMAMVMAWGRTVKSGHFTAERARDYAAFLARRYGGKPNIVLVNGGDTRGDDHPEIWEALGQTLHELDPNHLMTFHPFGGTQSSTWFHTAPWLDFNMFQSGHRRYDQVREGTDPSVRKGEDNWRYVLEDHARTPAKPTLDGEPSYENIPQGLHDANEPYWRADDVRRYAYWSVFAGACGHTYGNNAVIQMHRPNSGEGMYGVRDFWFSALHDPGAGQMRHLRALILSRPYFERIYDPSLIGGDPGEQYDRLLATRGTSYAFVYTYTGRSFDVVLGRLTGDRLKAHWFNPRTGEGNAVDTLWNSGTATFDPPGEPAKGNDWVLVLDDASRDFVRPGAQKVP